MVKLNRQIFSKCFKTYTLRTGLPLTFCMVVQGPPDTRIARNQNSHFSNRKTAFRARSAEHTNRPIFFKCFKTYTLRTGLPLTFLMVVQGPPDTRIAKN